MEKPGIKEAWFVAERITFTVHKDVVFKLSPFMLNW
jgi:hypothetical protein